MRTVTLTVKKREKPDISVEAEGIVPANFVDESYADLTVWEGNKEWKLTDFFDISCTGKAEKPSDVGIVLSGDTTRTVKRIGEYMEDGKITVRGDIGMHCGNFMKGGTIEIFGNADGWLGREMEGGKIICHGDASHYCGAGYRGVTEGMKGGLIEVFGNAGDYCCECLFGGKVIVHGSCGDMAGVDMKGGELFISKDCHRPCGNMKGGTVTVCGTAYAMPPAFSKEGEETLDSKIFTVFKGDIANRGNGTLKVASFEYY
ncbi:formylmethanofuran dehydrogenase subunit C [Methanomicrobium sp. W14]|uniref:formylmethanofuran dehydrogenase subunit C n=1 Tax=Methanomicrobium sp. W14 TaxID=2817839 RepID=UPI001AE115CE|nr:formylmethanofuran dehydrogenase subunit C [Methanomicrobium sp. W14]MBP2134006.1 formylmethanofuran dehydrogenase subunit C [Methanomicrobium sp. W14]